MCHSAADGPTCDLKNEFSVRARVGYGGGDFTVAQGCAYFAAEGRLFRQPLHQTRAQSITPEDGGQCSSPAVSPDGRYLLYVHSHQGNDVLALVDTAGENEPTTLIGGHDFFMQPCWNPRENQVAWIAWDHPSMPWDSSALYLGVLTPGQPLPDTTTTPLPDTTVALAADTVPRSILGQRTDARHERGHLVEAPADFDSWQQFSTRNNFEV